MELEDETHLMTPVPAQIADWARSWPATMTEPEEGESMAARRLSSVDLPQPDGPVMATISPYARRGPLRPVRVT